MLLAKLLVRGLFPDLKPWKELIRHRTKQLQPINRTITPWSMDIN